MSERAREMPMSRDRLTRATPAIAEPDTDRPKTDGSRHNHTQTDRETLRHVGKYTETKTRPTKYRDEDGGSIAGDVFSRELATVNDSLP